MAATINVRGLDGSLLYQASIEQNIALFSDADARALIHPDASLTDLCRVIAYLVRQRPGSSVEDEMALARARASCGLNNLADCALRPHKRSGQWTPPQPPHIAQAAALAGMDMMSQHTWAAAAALATQSPAASPPAVDAGEDELRCPICKGPGRRARYENATHCQTCYNGLYNDARKVITHLGRKGLTLPISGQLDVDLREFAAQLKAIVRPCPTQFQCPPSAFESSRPVKERCQRCRTLATLELMPEFSYNTLLKVMGSSKKNSGSDVKSSAKPKSKKRALETLNVDTSLPAKPAKSAPKKSAKIMAKSSAPTSTAQSVTLPSSSIIGMHTLPGSMPQLAYHPMMHNAFMQMLPHQFPFLGTNVNSASQS